MARWIALTISVPHHVGHVCQQYIEISIVDFFGKSVVFVRKGIDHVGDILLKCLYVLRIVDKSSKTMVHAESEIGRERVAVAEYILYDTLVSRRHHGMEVLTIADLIDVRPCRKVDIAVLAEDHALSVDDYFHFTFQYDDDKVISWAAGAGVSDVVAALNFTSEYIALYISHFLNGVFTEKNRRFKCFCPFFPHFR